MFSYEESELSLVSGSQLSPPPPPKVVAGGDVTDGTSGLGSSVAWQSLQIEQLQAELDDLRVQQIEMVRQKDEEISLLQNEVKINN